jgi:hypothetical protein
MTRQGITIRVIPVNDNRRLALVPESDLRAELDALRAELEAIRAVLRARKTQRRMK